jgi:hypothetical protein
MLIKSAIYVAGTVAVALAGYGILTQAAPRAAARIDGLAHDYVLGWDDAACDSNPLGCLKNRYTVLQGLEKQVDQSTRAIGSQLQRITAMVDEQTLLVAKNSAFLDQGKALFKAKAATANDPIEFAGKTYPNGQVFKQQLALLFQEKAGLESSLTDAKALQQKLGDRLDDLRVQSGNITLAKRMVPAQLELVQANMALADFGSNIDMINGVIKGSEAGIAETEQLIRTTKDLMEPTGQAGNAKVSDKAFDEFLAQ